MLLALSKKELLTLTLTLIFVVFLASCLGGTEMVVTPPEKVNGTAYIYSDPQNILKGEKITLHEIGKDDVMSDEILETEVTGSDGVFTIRYPRHMGPDTRYVLKMESVEMGYMPMYAIASQTSVNINLFSTVIFDLITSSAVVYVRNFSNEQIQLLQKKAEEIFNAQVAKGYIQLDGLSIQSIYSALQNAVESSQEFMNMFDNFSRSAVSLEIPFGKIMRNTAPIFIYRQPFNTKPNVYEASKLDFEVNSTDANGDTLFFLWYIDGKIVQRGGYFFSYVPGYDVVSGDQVSKIQTITMEVSDGGYVQKTEWTLTVFNKNRAPRIANIPVAAATEDILYTAIIEAVDDDQNYPLTISLQSGPAGMSFTQLTDRTAMVQWTPTNCQVGNKNAIFNITDSLGMPAIYNLAIKVADPNLPPSFLPISCTFTATETVPWSCIINISDLDMVPTGSGGTLNDGCPDTMGFSFIKSPASAVITKTAPDQATIDWRPKDNETGLEDFIIQVDDSHGAQKTATFQVLTTNINQAPKFFLNMTPGSYQQDDVDNTPPFNDPSFITAPPATLYEEASCSQLDITLSVYNGDLGELLTYRFFDPDPNPDPVHLTVTPSVPVPVITTEKSWGYSEVKVKWCVEDHDTPQVGKQIGVEVRDAVGNTDTLVMTFDLPERNQAPRITSVPGVFTDVHYMDDTCCDSAGANCNVIPNLAACPAAGSCYDQYGVVKGCWQDTSWSYPAQVIDPDGDPVSCSIGSVPATTIGVVPATCVMSWFPRWADLGIYMVTLTAEDNIVANPPPGHGISTSNFSFFVRDVNYPPHITSSAPANGFDGTKYTYEVVSDDPNITESYKKLSYSLVNPPSGMTISTLCLPAQLCKGEIEWTPTDAQAKSGGANFGVKVEDGGSPKLSHTQTNHVTLTDVNETPIIDYIPKYYVGPGQMLNFLITGYDPDAGDTVTLSAIAGKPTANYTFTDQGGGVATVLFTPDVSQIGVFDITYRITDSFAASSTKIGSIEVSNKPKIISLPQKQAKTLKQYEYTVRTIAAPGANISYSVVIGQSGMSFDGNVFKWTPNSTKVGVHPVTIRVTNNDTGQYDEQSWALRVKSTNNAPTVSAQNPLCDTVIKATESKTFSMTVSGADIDMDTLLYQWFVDDVWKMEESGVASSTFNNLFDSISAGEHTLKFVIDDGIDPISTTCDIHVRNANPSEGLSKVFAGRTISAAIQNSETGKIFLADKSGSYYYLTTIPDERDLFTFTDLTGCGSFIVNRFTLDTSHPDPNNYAVYLAMSGDALAGTNSYVKFFSGDSSCIASSKDKLFYSGFKYNGGSNTGYNYYNGSRTMVYHVDHSNPRYLKAYNKNTLSYEADVDLGIGAEGTSVNSITTGSFKEAFVADRVNHAVYVIDPGDNSIGTSIDLSGTCQNPFAMSYDTDTDELYAYCGGNGTVSIIEASDNSFITISGFPTSSTSIDPNDVFHLNTTDNLVYILSTNSKLTVWDLENNTIKTLNLTKQYDTLLYNDTTGTLFLVDYETAAITPVK